MYAHDARFRHAEKRNDVVSRRVADGDHQVGAAITAPLDLLSHESTTVANAEIMVGELGGDQIMAGDDLADAGQAEKERRGVRIADVHGSGADPLGRAPQGKALPISPDVGIRLRRRAERGPPR